MSRIPCIHRTRIQMKKQLQKNLHKSKYFLTFVSRKKRIRLWHKSLTPFGSPPPSGTIEFVMSV